MSYNWHSLSSYQPVEKFTGSTVEFYSPEFNSLTNLSLQSNVNSIKNTSISNSDREITIIHTHFPLGPLGNKQF